MMGALTKLGSRIIAAASKKPKIAGPLTMANIIRPQARERWMLPNIAAITPQYIEMTLRGALAGAHVQMWELLNLMEDSWPRLRKNVMEIKTAVRNRQMVVEAYREDDEEETATATERMKLVSAALRRWQADAAEDEGGFDDMVNDILDAWFKGTSIIQVEWQMLNAGKLLGKIWAPKAARWVHPANYGWDENLRIGLTDQSRRGLQPFPDDQFLIAKYKSKSGTILGGALLRPLVWWWCAANFSADWLLNLAQIFGLPFRWVNYSSTAPQETVDRICAMLQGMGSAGWAAFPEGTSMELKTDGTKSGADTPQGDMLDRADKQCDLLVLGQTLTSDTGGMGAGGGSKALGEVHADVRSGIIDAAAKFAASVIEAQLIPSILRLNYGDTDEAPTLTLEQMSEDDLAADATMIATLVTAGAGSIIGKDWLGKKFDIPKPQAGEETLEQQQQTTDPVLDRQVKFDQYKRGQKAAKPKDDAEVKAHAERLLAIPADAVYDPVFAREFAALIAKGDEKDEGRWVTVHGHPVHLIGIVDAEHNVSSQSITNGTGSSQSHDAFFSKYSLAGAVNRFRATEGKVFWMFPPSDDQKDSVDDHIKKKFGDTPTHHRYPEYFRLSSKENGHWITIEHRHVKVGDHGEIIEGHLPPGAKDGKLSEHGHDSRTARKHTRDGATGGSGAAGHEAPNANDAGGSAGSDPGVSATAHKSLRSALGKAEKGTGRDFDTSRAARNHLEKARAIGAIPTTQQHPERHLAEGGEHRVEISDDGARVMKHTKGGLFGFQPDVNSSGNVILRGSKASEYLTRNEAQNKAFGSDLRLEGSHDKEGGGFTVSQTHFKGDKPTHAEVSEHMKSKGFEKVSGDNIYDTTLEDTTWFHPKTGIIAGDAKPDNFKKSESGQIHALDLMVTHAEPGTPLHKAMMKGIGK